MLEGTRKLIVIISLYVDNIMQAWNNMKMLDDIKRWKSFIFEMEDMDKASYVLGVKLSGTPPRDP